MNQRQARPKVSDWMVEFLLVFILVEIMWIAHAFHGLVW